MKFKIISLILTLAIVFSIISFPASAASGVRSDIIDLRSDSNEYWWTREGSEPVLTSYFYPLSSSSNSVIVNWSLPRIEQCDTIYFSLFSTTIPTSVHFRSDGDFGQSVANYLGSNNDTHFYSVSGNGHLGQVWITINYSSAYWGQLALRSCFGYFTNGYSVPSASLEYLRTDITTGHIEQWPLGKVSGKLPLFVMENHLYNEISYIEFFVTLNKSHFPFSSLDQVSFFVQSASDIEAPTLSIIDADTGKYVGSAPLISSSNPASYKSNFFNPYGDVSWVYILHEFTFDLSGYSLEDYKITFECSIESIPLDFDPVDLYGYSFDLLNIIGYPLEVELPWYTRLFEFFNYHFNNLIRFISTGYNNMVSAINNLFNGIGSWFSTTWDHITGGFTDVKNTIVLWGQNIVNALTGTNSDAQDALDQSDQISGELGDVNQEMNDLNKIDPDQINPDINVVVPGGLSSSYTGFLAAIFQNPIIYQVISISLLISFAGYVLYGKR